MNRYARQVKLKELSNTGQELLSSSKVAIVGVGALGTVSSQLLVRAGVLNILLIDNDTVDIVNLQRQVLFDEEDVGKEKTMVAKQKLEKINSEARIELFNEWLTPDNAKVLGDYDLMLDCTDNMKARHVINDYCKESKKIWIHAAGSGVKGNILVVDNPDTFSKIFRTNESFDNCEEVGVINTLTNIIASLQVTEALKILTKQNHCKDLIRFNLWTNQYHKIKLK